MTPAPPPLPSHPPPPHPKVVQPTFRTTHVFAEFFGGRYNLPLQRRRLCDHRPALTSHYSRNHTARRS